MNRKLFIIPLVLASMAFIVPLASAITYGEPDGNGHPNVGVLVIEINGQKFGNCSGTLIDEDVYLTAAHCLVFLPSLGIEKVWVSFDSDFDAATATLHEGSYHIHPEAGHDVARLNDVGVVVFDEPIQGITPASLPAVGTLDELAPQGLHNQQFTAVGYGVTEPEIGSGPTVFSGFGIRRISASSFNALSDNWLRLSQNNATGDSGTCFGDSGGPNFFGANDGETDTVVAITSTGDAMCLATNDTQRIDTPSVLDFLDDFVD